jgi:hypothetical protein
VGSGDYSLAERDLFEISQDAGGPAIIVYLLTLQGDRCDYIIALCTSEVEMILRDI